MLLQVHRLREQHLQLQRLTKGMQTIVDFGQRLGIVDQTRLD